MKTGDRVAISSNGKVSTKIVSRIQYSAMERRLIIQLEPEVPWTVVVDDEG